MFPRLQTLPNIHTTAMLQVNG